MPGAPLNDLRRPLRAQRDDLLAALARVVDRGLLVHGPENEAFERELAAYLGVRHAVGVACGTDALELALRAATGPRRGVVVTVANAGGYTTVAARRAGLLVRFCDVDPLTHCLDPGALEPLLDEEVGVVVVTHLYGRVADVPAVRAACAPLGIHVLEDCAQAFGATTADGAAGALADLAAFSFYPTKNLGALGDGGAVTTDDGALAARVRRLAQYGWAKRYVVEEDGGRNSRLDEVQAAVLRRRLPGVEAGNARRREIIGRYAAAAGPRVRVLDAPPSHAGHLAVVETDDASDLARHLADHRIGSGVHYPVPDHRQPAYSGEYAGVRLPVTEALVGRILTLPCFPEMTEDEIEAVCRALVAY